MLYIYTSTHIHIYIYIYMHIYTSLTILIASENYTKANESTVRQLYSLPVNI
jgi:hypothetical protein